MKIKVETDVKAPIDLVWKYWTSPEDIIKWNNASDDWHTPYAKNDLRSGGTFLYRMEAKDGSSGFDFCGVYDYVNSPNSIVYTLLDGRKVELTFTRKDAETKIVEIFEAEIENPLNMQRDGWQAILNNFKKYAESSS